MYDESTVTALSLDRDIAQEEIGFKMTEPQTVSAKKIERSVFENVQLVGMKFEGCHFYQVRFERCGFSGVVFKNCTFIDCQFVEISGSAIEIQGGTFVLSGQDWVESEQVPVDWNFSRVLILSKSERPKLPQGKAVEVWFKPLNPAPAVKTQKPAELKTEKMPSELTPAQTPASAPMPTPSVDESIKGRFSELEK